MGIFKQSVFYLTTAEDQRNSFFGEVRNPPSLMFIPGQCRIANGDLQRTDLRRETADLADPIDQATRSLAVFKQDIENLLAAMNRAAVPDRSPEHLDSCGRAAETVGPEPPGLVELKDWARELADDLSRFSD